MKTFDQIYRINLREEKIDVQAAGEGVQVARKIGIDPINQPLNAKNNFDLPKPELAKELGQEELNEIKEVKKLKLLGEKYNIDLIKPMMQLKSKGYKMSILPPTSDGNTVLPDCMRGEEERAAGYHLFGRWGIIAESKAAALSGKGSFYVCRQEGGHKPGTQMAGYWGVKGKTVVIRGRSIEPEDFVYKNIPRIIGWLCGDGRPNKVALI